MATNTNAVLKSTKYDANGRNIVDEPNPAIVPIISDKKPIRKNMVSDISINNL